VFVLLLRPPVFAACLPFMKGRQQTLVQRVWRVWVKGLEFRERRGWPHAQMTRLT